MNVKLVSGSGLCLRLCRQAAFSLLTWPAARTPRSSRFPDTNSSKAEARRPAVPRLARRLARYAEAQPVREGTAEMHQRRHVIGDLLAKGDLFLRHRFEQVRRDRGEWSGAGCEGPAKSPLRRGPREAARRAVPRVSRREPVAAEVVAKIASSACIQRLKQKHRFLFQRAPNARRIGSAFMQNAEYLKGRSDRSLTFAAPKIKQLDPSRERKRAVASAQTYTLRFRTQTTSEYGAGPGRALQRTDHRGAREQPVEGRVGDRRYVRVRGHAKVMAHLMFGLLALTVDQILRLAT